MPPTRFKKKYNMLSLNDKKQLLVKLKNGESYKNLMQFYNIGRSTIFNIKKNENEIFTAYEKLSKRLRDKRKYVRKCQNVALDKAVHDWFLSKRSEGMAISGPMLITKAKTLKEEMGINSQISFSSGWLTSFKERHGIRQLSVSGEKLSADIEHGNKYCETFENLVCEYGLTSDCIYNADETGLYWRCLPKKTLAGQNETSAPGFKLHKERLTVLTCANASGGHKLKLLVIGKSRSPRALKGVQGLPITYKSQKSAWMTKDLFKDWFFSNFIPAVKENMQQLGKASHSKCVLVIDNCSAHGNEKDLVSECGNIFACFFPPNVTSIIQPMDQGVIQNFKTLYKHDFMLKMVNSNLGPIEFQKQFNIKDAIFAMANAWNIVSAKTLMNAWKKLMPQKSGNEMLEQPVASCSSSDTTTTSIFSKIEAIQALVNRKDPSLHVADSELEDWINDKNVIGSPDHQSIVCITNPSSFESDNSHTDSDIRRNSMTWEKAESKINDIIEFLEVTPCASNTDRLLAHKLKNNIIEHKLNNIQVNDLRLSLKNSLANLI